MREVAILPARTAARGLLAIAASLAVAAATLVAPAPAGASVQHATWVGGTDLFATSVQLSNRLPATSVVYLVSAESGGDALSVPPAAAAQRAHVLMVRRDSIPSNIVQRLRELNPRHVNLVGSESVLSGRVWSAARAALPGASLWRMGGNRGDRIDSGLAMLRNIAGSTGVNDVFVIGRNGYSDGISAGSVAARMGAALLPAMGDAGVWAQRIAGELRAAGVDRVHIVGGRTMVPQAYVDALRARWSGSISEMSGPDRYQTNARLVQRFVPSVAPAHSYLFAGNGHADSTGASVLAASQGTVLMLSGRFCHPHDAVPAQVRRLGSSHVVGVGTRFWITENALRLNICQPGETPNGEAPPSTGGTGGTGGSVGGGTGTGGSTGGGSVYYANCDAVRAAGAAPLLRGQPGYRSGLDRDGDGRACE